MSKLKKFDYFFLFLPVSVYYMFFLAINKPLKKTNVLLNAFFAYFLTLANPIVFLSTSQMLNIRWIFIIFFPLLYALFYKIYINVNSIVLLPIISALFSAIVVATTPISIIKFVSFAIPFYFFYEVIRENNIYLVKKVYLFIKTIFIISLPLIFFPSIGKFVNGTGFSGILNHPQAFGIFIIVVLPFFLFFEKGIMRIFWIFLILYYAYATESRLSIFGSAFIVLLYIAYVNQRKLTLQRFLILFTLPIILFLLSVAFQNQIISIIEKRSNTSSIEETFFASRGFLIEKSLENFYESPLFGIGFSVGRGNFDETTEATDFSLSYSIEKGNLYIAILEEQGVIGFAFFLIFIVLLYSSILRKQSHISIFILTAILITNLGESTFFSMGGMGGLFWFLFCLTRNFTVPSKTKFEEVKASKASFNDIKLITEKEV